MSNDFQSLDIILFAMIAIFLAIRLRSVLGRRDGNDTITKRDVKSDKGNPNINSNVIELTDANVANDDAKVSQDQNLRETRKLELADPAEEAEIDAEVKSLSALDPQFTSENFIVGARVAFEMVLKAFASGEIETLENLLSKEVLGNFALVIKDREKFGHEVSDTLVGIKSADMVEVYLENQTANITVKFISEQIKVSYDKNNVIVDGDPKSVIVVTDFWTFSRKIQNNNPNWILVATRSLD